MSSTDQIVALFESLSFAEKLSLNERLATAMRKEGGGAAGKKRGPKAKDGEAKPKRKAALGTLAWMAYVKHIKDTRPDALEGLTKEAEKLTSIKVIRAEDPEGYKSFVAAWKEEHKDDGATASEAEGEEDDSASVASVASAPAPEAKAPKTITPAEKIAAIRAAAAAKKATGGGGAEAAKAAPEPAKAKGTPAKKPAAAAPAPGAPKKAVKTAKKAEAPTFPVLEIEGVEYWHDPGSNYLWLKTGDDTVDGLGEEVGYFQPDNAEEPIRTAAFGDD
jgi:hypothetical protein